MQDATHILEKAFEASILVVGFVYLSIWMAGRKVTNRKALSVFAIGFVSFLLLNFFTVPVYVLLIACWTPSLVKLVRRRFSLNSKQLPGQIDGSEKTPVLPPSRNSAS
jgi:chromate transport protein ChrA